MKKIILAALASVLASHVHAQNEHEWRVTLKVLDEQHNPIAGASANVGYYTNSIGASSGGSTDTNGIFCTSHASYGGSLGFAAESQGYYSTRQTYKIPFVYDELRWNPTQNMILRVIGHPIPMYAKRVETKIQKENGPLAFDLQAGDWVTPDGKGEHADIFFTLHRNIINDREYDATLTATFPNREDGIVVAPSESIAGSAFKTSRTAIENGYNPQLSLHYTHLEHPESVFGYFFRVRTVLDDNGNIKSALYGKISGNFRFYAGTRAPRAGMGFDYYLNPTPNDRNVEFNPKKNLVRDLKPDENVSEP
jgi:hypothetical protein